MGLQIWSPSKPVLSSMACLDVESPSICRGKFKSVLQHCLQQRRTREQLVEQGILPPLKTPTAFHKQIRSLERARTGTFLKHKLCSRPERSELVRMHILEETQAEPSLQATQIKLKRARLAIDLNEKISQRPGPMELVEKKILPVDFGVEKLGNGGEADKSETPHVPDVYSFDEDSSDTSSPQQPNSQQSPFSSSPKESGRPEASCSSSNSSTSPQLSPTLSSTSTSNVVVSTAELKSNQQIRQPAVPGVSSGPLLVKQSLAKLSAEKSRSKKSKEPKPRVKKLKYHQYVPPDQKQELSDVPMDSSYSRLLQQQQQFLHLQILSQQQQQQYNQAVLPVTLKYGACQHKSSLTNLSRTEAQTSCSAVVLRGNTPSASVQLHHANANRKPDHLPANLDEMKVAELKMELKLRSLPVSGTKTDLIERLKLFQESFNIQHAATMETASQSENIKFSPPVSLIASKVSKLGIEDCNKTDSSTKVVSDMPTGSIQCTNTLREKCPTEMKSNQRDSDKDKRLHEKERQIKELMKKLQQEQKLVEELKMQLEVEKRSQQSDSPPQLYPLVPVQVKEETRTASACSLSHSSPVLPGLVKQEESADQSHATASKQFIIAQQTITQAETLQCVKAGAQILLPAVAVAVELPAKSIHLQTPASSTAPGHIQTSGQVPQKADISAALQQQPTTQLQQLTKTWTMNIKAENLLNMFPETGCDGASSNQAVPNKTMTSCSGQSKFTNHVSKNKDPPRYEDAVKQTRSILPAAQGPTAASQQMDDLFDVLIESGEMSPFARQNPPSQEKPLAVTASVTTLPINTVLSRPPPLVQVAQMPVEPLNPSTDLEPLTSRNELETLVDSKLAADAEAQKLKLMEELNSPVVTMDVNFSENMPPSDVNLTNATMENMDWLDLSLSVPAEGINPLDMSVPGGVFSSDFLDSHELQLNWD